MSEESRRQYLPPPRDVLWRLMVMHVAGTCSREEVERVAGEYWKTYEESWRRRIENAPKVDVVVPWVDAPWTQSAIGVIVAVYLIGVGLGTLGVGVMSALLLGFVGLARLSPVIALLCVPLIAKAVGYLCEYKLYPRLLRYFYRKYKNRK